MKIETTNVRWPELEEAQQTTPTASADAAGAKKASSVFRQDTVDISAEGKRKSAALQSAAGEGSGSPAVVDSGTGQAADATNQTADAAGQAGGPAGGLDDSSEGGSGTAASVTVAELKEQLQTKKNAIKARKDELEAAKALAENDLAQQDEVKRLKQSLATLEKEASKIQTSIYSA